MVDEPKGTHWGATVAAPVFQGFAQKAMWYLRVPPDENQPQENEPENSGRRNGDSPNTDRSGLG